MFPLRGVGDHLTPSAVIRDFRSPLRLWEHSMLGWRPLEAGSWKLGVGGLRPGMSLSLWVGGPVIWALVRGMGVSAPGFLLELSAVLDYPRAGDKNQ